jgi:DNA-binding LacI/PurR family transcriptional regulator
MGFMDGARIDFGRRIPQDLCVVGFDDIEQAGWESYMLTTFRQPVEAMADHVVGRLVGELQPAGRRIFKTVPTWRRSVRPQEARPSQ